MDFFGRNHVQAVFISGGKKIFPIEKNNAKAIIRIMGKETIGNVQN